MKAFFRTKYLRNGMSLFLLMTAVGFWLMAANYRRMHGIGRISVELKSDDQNRFLSPELVQRIATEAVQSEPYRPYGAVQQALAETNYVRDIVMITSSDRSLLVRASVRMPVARFIGSQGSSYVDMAGEHFPWSPAFSARVLIVRLASGLQDTTAAEAKAVVRGWVAVAQQLHADPLLRAMISEVRVLETGEGVLLTQVGNLQIQFGRPTNPVEKFATLKSFVREVLTHTGWGYYRELDLRYGGQVVARKA